jgi:hypothetical protein
MATGQCPILIGLVDDYDVVLTGVASMLDPYRDRVLVAEIDANEPLIDTVDIALYDSFAQPESDHDEIDVLVRSPRAKRVVVYTWNFGLWHKFRDADVPRVATETGLRGVIMIGV